VHVHVHVHVYAEMHAAVTPSVPFPELLRCLPQHLPHRSLLDACHGNLPSAKHGMAAQHLHLRCSVSPNSLLSTFHNLLS
jgi:hypothetical protein